MRAFNSSKRKGLGRSFLFQLLVSKTSKMANTKQLAKEKEMAMSVSNVYLHVVEDVINNVRADFQSEGVDDNVLNELQSVRKFSPLVWTPYFLLSLFISRKLWKLHSFASEIQLEQCTSFVTIFSFFRYLNSFPDTQILYPY